MGCLLVLVAYFILAGAITQIPPEYQWIGWIVLLAGMLWDDNKCECKCKEQHGDH